MALDKLPVIGTLCIAPDCALATSAYVLQAVQTDSLAGLVVKVSAWGAEDLVFESYLQRDFPGLSQRWLSSGYPARSLALQGQR